MFRGLPPSHFVTQNPLDGQMNTPLGDIFYYYLHLKAPQPVQFSAGIGVPQTVFIIVLVLNSSLWLIPAGNSNSSTVHEEPPQMRAPPPLMRDHPSWPVEEQFYVYFGTKLV